MEIKEMMMTELGEVTGGAVSYEPFAQLFAEHSLTVSDLISEGIMSPLEAAKVTEGQRIGPKIINRLCSYFGCQPSDIMTEVPDQE